MKFKSLKQNIFTPLVSTDEWCKKYPEVDREYIWSYPLQYGGKPFNPIDIFRSSDVPLPSLDAVVYIHTPACLFRCPMCPFYVEVVKSRKDIMGYAKAVIKELHMYKKANLTKNLNLNTIYFGGGTATLLYPEDIKEIIDEVKK